MARQVVESIADDPPDGASFLASLSNKLERLMEVLEDASDSCIDLRCRN